MSSSNVVRTHPYAHVQHMKTVKHLIYIFDIDVGAMILNGSTASACTICCGFAPQDQEVPSRKLENFQKLDQHQERKQQ